MHFLLQFFLFIVIKHLTYFFNTYIFFRFFTDLSLQDSLLHDFNNVCNVRSVRIGHTGRHGRYAVIYLASMSEVAKALDESRLITKSYPYAEVDVILAGDEVVEDK